MATLSEQRPTVPSTREPGTEAGIAARYVNIIAGAWLFISAFIWQHSAASRTNTWIVGALAVIFALIALQTPAVRYANTVLSIWLFISTFAFAHVTRGTVWNNVIVAIVMFVASLIPSSAMGSGQRPRRFIHA